MSSAPSLLRRGFCPGVWTPMASGDGLIVRVRTSVEPLSATRLCALAALARAHGNGLIEVTRRANLQLRGVRAETLLGLQTQLVALGLADQSPVRERKLATLATDPLAPGAATNALAEQIGNALCKATLTSEIPAKFAIVVDAGSGSLGALSADVRVRPGGHGAALYAGRDFVGVVAARAVPAAVVQLVEALASQPSERARDHAIAAVRARLSPLILACDPASAAVADVQTIGFQALPWPRFGVALPFGSGDAARWEALAGLCERFGDGSLRTTPSRALLVTGVATEARAALADAARAAGLIVDPADPLLRAVACTGAPGCGSARGETRSLATSLAASLLPRLGPEATLHVSGCPKGCARSGPATITLVHDEAGVRLGQEQNVAHTLETPAMPRASVLARLAALGRGDKVPDPMTRQYDYERDADAIYRRSFAIIRAEAELARFSPIEERVAVRLIHTSGMVELARDIVFGAGFATAATAALRAGKPILCDTKMVVSGVTRARLPADNEVLSFVDHPETAARAAALGTTRTAAALSFWADKLEGAVVAIGNAPTALFRLLELFDETAARPAAIIGLPVGFVGAAESKDALIADGRVPAMIVRGRKGGSAMTAAAINALASEKE